MKLEEVPDVRMGVICLTPVYDKIMIIEGRSLESGRKMGARLDHLLISPLNEYMREEKKK